MDHSGHHHLLVQFLGGSRKWTNTCTAAHRFAKANNICSCQCRFQYLLILAEQGEPGPNQRLVQTEQLASEVSLSPLCFFWHARIICAIKHLDRKLGRSDPCASLFFHAGLAGKLICRSCQSRSRPVWERRSINIKERMYYCSKCILDAHQHIKHAAETACLYDTVVQRNLDMSSQISRHDAFIKTAETFWLEIYGLSMTIKVIRRPGHYKDVSGIE